jgi:phytoene dehydrogenase-like protein
MTDIVVIGGGHNGLVAANYLMDAGHSVVVVEANEHVGGMTTTHSPIANAPNHLVNSYSVDAFFWDSFPPSRELKLEKHGLKRNLIDPGHLYLAPDGASIGFWADLAKTADEIRHFSEQDARAYVEFATLLDGFADLVFGVATTNPTRPDWRTVVKLARTAGRSRRQLAEMAAMATSSITEVVAERFEHQTVRDAIHATCGSTVPNDQGGSGVAFLWLATMHRHACARPVGGVQAIPDALERRLVSMGGRVETGTPVAEILIAGDRAVGVRLADGRDIRADIVLAACDPKTTLQRLLPAGALSRAEQRRIDAVPVKNMGIGQGKVDLALKGKLSMTRHQAWRRDDLDVRLPSHTIGTEQGMERTFRRSAVGLDPLVGEFSLWPVITTALDPTQAPAGQDTLYLYIAVCPYEPVDKDALGEAVVKTAADYYDGLEELEIGRQVLTNKDIGEATHATGGNVTHVDMAIGRAAAFRPAFGFGGYRTPVDGLYLTGAGTHPGGGITGAPGYNASRAILKEKSASWRRAPASSRPSAVPDNVVVGHHTPDDLGQPVDQILSP